MTPTPAAAAGASPEPSSRVRDPWIGRTLAGQYVLVDVLGRGATGVVYRARHTLLERDFAVKLLAGDASDDLEFRARLLREAEALGRLSDPHVVPVRHVGEENGCLFVVMDACAGETLARLLDREGALPPARAVALAAQVAQALEAAHRAGIVHRDLKPANVIVETTAGGDHARVVDFGLARLQRGPTLPGALETSAGAIVGTPAYMSPEQIQGRGDVDGRSDVFSLGVMLHQMCTGRRPWESDSTLSLLMRISDTAPEPLPVSGPHAVPTGLAAVVASALAKDPAMRPDARAFREALAAVGLPAGGGARWRRWRAAILAIAAAGAVLVAILLAVGGGRDEPEARTPSARRLAAREALASCRWRDAIAELAPLEGVGASGEDHLMLGQARTALGLPTAAADLSRAEERLPSRDRRVAMAWARFHVAVEGQPMRALDRLAGILAASPGDTEARVARVAVLIDPTSRAAIVEGGLDPISLAEADLRQLEAEQPGDVTVARLFAGVAAYRTETAANGQQARREADAAIARLREVVAAHGDAADAHLALGEMLHASARAWARTTEYEKSRADHEESSREFGTAIDLLGGVKAPDPCRAADVVHAVHRRSDAWYALGDREHHLAEVRLLAGLPYADLEVLRLLARVTRQSGLYEEAIPLHVALHRARPDPEVLFDLAFCYQQLGLRNARRGEREAAQDALARAIATYDEGVRMKPRGWNLLAYRGETHVALARIDPGRAEEALAKARADFEAAIASAPGSVARSVEIRHRTAEFHAATGDVERALREARIAIGGGPEQNPAVHARFVLCLQSVAAGALRSGDGARARSLLDEALQAADLLARRTKTSAAAGAHLRGTTLLLLAEAAATVDEARGARADALAALEQSAAGEIAEDGETPVATLLLGEARLEARGGEAASLAQDARRRRHEDLAKGRWDLSPDYLRVLASAAGSAGEAATRDAALSAAARALP